MNVTILGGGLSGITTAYFLQEDPRISSITILEKENLPGGLCRSICADGYTYDIGPHIIFSKDKEILNLMLNLLGDSNKLKRSNKIIHGANKDIWINYPFENDLSQLTENELRYCIAAFRNNPYEEYDASNMLQYFLKIFGEGITNLYLRPYNQKIWKFDPSFMDTSMVERIPKPTNDDINRSAAGETVEGYLHQLYFNYPKDGGIETLFKCFVNKLDRKCKLKVSQDITSICYESSRYIVKTKDNNNYISDILISTIPVQELTSLYYKKNIDVVKASKSLHFNSIIIAFVKTTADLCGNNFAFMVADSDIIFHRISKMNFLGKNYANDGTTYMVEITYRNKDYIDSLSTEQLYAKIKQGICRINFAKKETDVQIINCTKHKYAYVIYDLNHGANIKKIRQFYTQEGIYLNGRFGNFEYWNMDKIIRESKNLAERIKERQDL